MHSDYTFIKNYPLKVRMYGCEGNIYSLRQSGWDIAIECFYNRYLDSEQIRICGQHRRNGQKLLSQTLSVKIEDLMQHNHFSLEHVVIDIEIIAENIRIMGEVPLNNFHPFTANSPSFGHVSEHEFNPYNIPFFSEPNPENEIILPSDDKSIDELLKELLSKQSVKQKEIREKRIKAKKSVTKDNIVPIKSKIEIIKIGDI